MERAGEYIESSGDEASSEAMKDLERMNEGEELEEGETRTIHWFYYGDLLDAALEILNANAKSLQLDLWNVNSRGGKIKIILGDIDYINPETGQIKKINLARVPICLNAYSEWWTDKVIKPLKEMYVFKAFLRDSITSLVKNALTNRCRRGGQPALQVRLSVDFIHLSENNPVKFFEAAICGTHDKSFYFQAVDQAVSVEENNKQEKGYRSGDVMFIFAPSNKPSHLNPYEKETDINAGIYHFVLGQEDTPIISANFNKNDQPYFLEAKAEKNGILSDTVQLSEPYHCNMTLYGNATFRPGRMVHIRFPLSWFGDPLDRTSPARVLGLGGYFHINKASNVIKLMGSRLEWLTDLTMLWQSFGNETSKPAPNIPVLEEADPPEEAPPPPGEDPC
jgi:hypothetical protein